MTIYYFSFLCLLLGVIIGLLFVISQDLRDILRELRRRTDKP